MLEKKEKKKKVDVCLQRNIFDYDSACSFRAFKWIIFLESQSSSWSRSLFFKWKCSFDPFLQHNQKAQSTKRPHFRWVTSAKLNFLNQVDTRTTFFTALEPRTKKRKYFLKEFRNLWPQSLDVIKIELMKRNRKRWSKKKTEKDGFPSSDAANLKTFRDRKNRKSRKGKKTISVWDSFPISLTQLTEIRFNFSLNDLDNHLRPSVEETLRKVLKFKSLWRIVKFLQNFPKCAIK